MNNPTCTCDEINARHCQYHQEIADLEERLRVAVEALEWYDMRFSKEYKFNNGVGYDMSNQAKQALAKLKGGSDDIR
jgi:hypothetical protein